MGKTLVSYIVLWICWHLIQHKPASVCAHCTTCCFWPTLTSLCNTTQYNYLLWGSGSTDSLSLILNCVRGYLDSRNVTSYPLACTVSLMVPSGWGFASLSKTVKTLVLRWSLGYLFSNPYKYPLHIHFFAIMLCETLFVSNLPSQVKFDLILIADNTNLRNNFCYQWIVTFQSTFEPLSRHINLTSTELVYKKKLAQRSSKQIFSLALMLYRLYLFKLYHNAVFVLMW